jgi:transcription initiation factor TFIIIB Brf1 subunit/transcription initiation factor TFIIB
MFPKRGKFFPDSAGRRGTEISYAAVIGAALREELRQTRRTAKAVAQWTGASERTVKNWLAGKNGPRGPQLICIMRHSPGVLQAVLQLSGRDHAITGASIVEARKILAETLQRIDLLAGK